MFDNDLIGKCLVATPQMEDENFSKTVVYICTHNQGGAMGFVVNRQLKEFRLSDLYGSHDNSKLLLTEPIILHQGGPLEKIRGFVLHSRDYAQEGSMPIDKNLAVSSSVQILNDIVDGQGPRYNLIALGYSSWSPKQLERELILNNWLVVEPSMDLLFKTADEEKWQRAIDELGFDLERLCPYTGRA